MYPLVNAGKDQTQISKQELADKKIGTFTDIDVE